MSTAIPHGQETETYRDSREGQRPRRAIRRDDRHAAASYGRGEAALFSLTLFLSAALLFTVQPMFAKMVLPLLGGAPAVWNACLVFYQAALLAGYLYAHLSLKWLGAAAASGAAPGAAGPGVDRPADPRGRRLAAAGHDVPGPLAVDAAGGFLGPAVPRRVGQRRCSRPGSPRRRPQSAAAGRDPYFLYAASNLGSLLALLAYPLVIEAKLTLRGRAAPGRSATDCSWRSLRPVR